MVRHIYCWKGWFYYGEAYLLLEGVVITNTMSQFVSSTEVTIFCLVNDICTSRTIKHISTIIFLTSY